MRPDAMGLLSYQRATTTFDAQEFANGKMWGHSGTADYRTLGDLADIPATNLGASMGQPYTLRM